MESRLVELFAPVNRPKMQEQEIKFIDFTKANGSSIEWTDFTWNPARGCTRVSEGCKNCYMQRDAVVQGWDGFTVQRTSKLKYPIEVAKKFSELPILMFTSSLTDIFHEEIDSWRDEIWQVIKECAAINPMLHFQILTKRPQRILENLPSDWADGYPNVWVGVSVENQKAADERLPLLNQVPALIRFISAEPLLGKVKLTKAHGNFDWIIIGGETGNDTGAYQYRQMKVQWAENLITNAYDQGINPFVKQLGTHLYKELKLNEFSGAGKRSKSKMRAGAFTEATNYPSTLKVREMPAKWKLLTAHHYGKAVPQFRHQF